MLPISTHLTLGLRRFQHPKLSDNINPVCFAPFLVVHINVKPTERSSALLNTE